MKLTTNNGELDLPVDFSFEVELNNPFFSDEGDSTIPATIPATPNNLKVLDNIHRVDRANRFMKTIPATLTAGSIQKHGQLIIDTLSMKDGIAVSLAIENSDLYTQYKSKSLKEIFASKIRDDWNKDIPTLVEYLTDVFHKQEDDDFILFPIAVDPYEYNEQTIYQFNNEQENAGDLEQKAFVWRARTINEQDINVSVTDGYGISPFLYLHKMISLLFQQIGLSVTYNCLDRDPYSDIVLLNNCSDTIVKGIIKYSDLVPSCTLSEFLDFLHNKFGILCRVDSSTKNVSILMLQDILSANSDLDITSKVIDGLETTIKDTSRVVLNSETTIDGTSPAAETFDLLIEKYGYYIEVSEREFEDISNNNNPAYFDCLILRKITGEFYELRRTIGNIIIPHLIGTNYFKYDRKNSINQENFSSSDVIPGTIIYNSSPYLYLGERLNLNTTYGDTKENTEQKIMIAWSWRNVANNLFGSIQKDIGSSHPKPFSLTTYDMYDFFWSNYNNLLRNGLIKLKGTVMYDNLDILSLDITRPKLYRGQNLLPLKTTFEISEKLKNHDSEFILIKDFLNSEKDVKIIPETKQKYQWMEDYLFNEEDIKSLKNKFPYQYQGLYAGYLHDMIAYYDGFTYKITPNNENEINIGIPKSEGEYSTSIRVDCELNPKAKIYLYTDGVIGEEIDIQPPSFKVFSYCDIRYKSVPV